MVSGHMWISVDKQKHSRRNKSFSKIYQFLNNQSEEYKNSTGLAFATGPSLNLYER